MYNPRALPGVDAAAADADAHELQGLLVLLLSFSFLCVSFFSSLFSGERGDSLKYARVWKRSRGQGCRGSWAIV